MKDAPDGGLVMEDERIFLRVPQPQDTHNAGQLAFGP